MVEAKGLPLVEPVGNEKRKEEGRNKPIGLCIGAKRQEGKQEQSVRIVYGEKRQKQAGRLVYRSEARNKPIGLCIIGEDDHER